MQILTREEKISRTMKSHYINGILSHLKDKNRINWNKGLTREQDKRIAQPWLGKKRPEMENNTFRKGFPSKYKGKQFLQIIGEKHWNWKGGTSFEHYTTEFNKQLKEFIRNLYGRKCQYCGELENKEKLCIHHIDYNKKNCSINNLIPLCRICHLKTNSKTEEYWISIFTPIVIEKVVEVGNLYIYEQSKISSLP